MEPAVSFGKWLRKRRRGLDLTQVELAKRAGCAQVTIKKLEADQLRPSKQLAEAVMRQLGVESQEINAFVRYARSGLLPEIIPNAIGKNNLPAQLTTFIGRVKEMEDVEETLIRHRLVTLKGPGGVGKSRLALQVAKYLLRQFPDGVWLVELSPLTDPSLVPRRTAITMGLRDEPHRPIIDMLCDYLSGKNTLLVLDNCEHLVDACGHMLSRILRAAPNLFVLATSRESLGVEGELNYQVPALQLPALNHDDPIESVSRSEAGQMFIELARSATSTFAPTDINAPAIAKICQRLDGIPLAIELAAAKTRVLSVKQIAERLENCFQLLTDNGHATLKRHQTLRASMDWSFELLSTEEQILFRRLSVFVNGWTLEAVESICGDSAGKIRSGNILKTLNELINKSLVHANTYESEARYHILEIIRQYSFDKITDAGEQEIFRDRHLEYYLNLAETAEPHLVGSEQLEWLARLDAEHDNIRAALKWSLSKKVPEQALRLSAAMGKFWDIRCHALEGAKWLEMALAMPTQDGMDSEKIARVRALYQDASLADILDDLDRLKNSAEASLILCETLEEPCDLAVARFYLGVAHFRFNEIAQAIKSFERCLEEFRLVGNLYWEAWSQRMLSIIYNQIGEKKMSDSFAEDLQAARKSGDRYLIAWVLCDQALACLSSNKLDEANAYIRECESLYDELGNRPGHFYVAKSQIAFAGEDHELAKTILAESIEKSKLIGEQNWQAIMLQNIGVLERDEENYEQAKKHMQEALKIIEQMGDKSLIGGQYALLGQLEYLQGNTCGAKDNFIKGLTFAKELNYPGFQIGTLFTFSRTFIDMRPLDSVRILSVWHTFIQNKNIPMSRRIAGYYEHTIEQMRQCLDESAFDEAWEEGEKMSLDEALELALKTLNEM